jgi:hypothetical protein
MLYTALLISEYVLAAAVFVALFFISAPYGRFGHHIHRFIVPARLGWFLMELPALMTLPLFYVTGRGWEQPLSATLYLVVWFIHYGQRDLLYPLIMPKKASPMPVAVMMGGVFFNILNGYVNGWGLFHLDQGIGITDPRMVAGLILFLAGWVINIHSDAVLRKLKKETGEGYAVPLRGLHRLVASPNYLGEFIEWCGWALMTFTLGGAAFAVFTFANLAPRAWKQRIWYRETFGADYPAHRRAIIPWIF